MPTSIQNYPMRNVILIVAFALLSFTVIAQGPRFDLGMKDFQAKKLVILDMDSVVSQKDSLLIAKKWIGDGISFQHRDQLKKSAWNDENTMYVSTFPIDTEKSFFALIAGGKSAEALMQNDSLNYKDLNQFVQFLIIDANKLNVGLEPTFILALCELSLHGARASKLADLDSKLMINEWLAPFEYTILDVNDVSKVYRHQSELAKINVNTVQFSDSASFKGPALSQEGKIAYADRQHFNYKGEKYIINYIYTIGKGLTFYNIEPRNKAKSTNAFSRSYLKFLFQPKPMKPGLPYEQQMREFKIPSRQ